MLRAARDAGARIQGNTPVERITRQAGGYDMVTPRGTVRAQQVVIATNGYTGPGLAGLQRTVVPIATYMIATAELAPGLAASLLPTTRAVSESRRVVHPHRRPPEGRPPLFGGPAPLPPAPQEP